MTKTAAETTRTEVLEMLVAGAKCNGCAGTGKRGRGKCRACEGRGSADLNHPRIRYNWGYHDGANDHARGNARQVVANGPANEHAVSYASGLGGKECGWFYAAGYQAGIEAVRNGTYNGTSDAGWYGLVGDLVTEPTYKTAMRSWS
jgi:hypothetical protein